MTTESAEVKTEPQATAQASRCSQLLYGGNALVPDGLLDLLNAVGHVGADFGYGPYRLSADQIRQAQEFYDMLKSQGGE